MKNLDVFSLDIDSIEFYVLSAFLKMGFRPKIIVVEYNSAFGPDKSITVKYSPDFYKKRSNYKINMHYYGVSVTGYKNLLQRYDYRFVTVESKGINAFFILEKEFDRKFIKNLKPGIDFLENQYTTLSSKTNWKDQFSQISNLEFVKIDKI